MTITVDPLPLDHGFWVGVAEDVRDNPDLLPWLQDQHPETYGFVIEGLSTLAVEASFEEWRDPHPDRGARPGQLIPGTPGSFSPRVDWSLFLMCGGRGSGKSLAGAKATEELLLGREWRERPRWALVGQTLDSVRIDMVENTLLEILPPGVVHKWNRGPCELWLWVPASGGGRHLAYVKGYSSEIPRKLRGPNFHGGWFDELATWRDADRSPQAEGSTFYTAMFAMRAHDQHTWTPRVIGTTTPRPVRLLRNVSPEDPMNPGVGIYDDAATVVSTMPTLENIDNLSSDYVRQVVEPLEGTRLYRQEVLGELIDASFGAMWSPELIDKMTVLPQAIQVLGGGIVKTVVGLDPSVGAGLGDEAGIVVVGLGADGRAYVLEDVSRRCPASEWCALVDSAFRRWQASAVVVEVNQGGELVAETLGRYAAHLPIVEVRAKKGKEARAEPVALLSDQGRLLLAGSFPLLTTQMKTWVGGGESPDRLDAMVYAVLWLVPPREGLDNLVSINRARSRHRARR